MQDARWASPCERREQPNLSRHRVARGILWPGLAGWLASAALKPNVACPTYLALVRPGTQGSLPLLALPAPISNSWCCVLNTPKQVGNCTPQTPLPLRSSRLPSPTSSRCLQWHKPNAKSSTQQAIMWLGSAPCKTSNRYLHNSSWTKNISALTSTLGKMTTSTCSEPWRGTMLC